MLPDPMPHVASTRAIHPSTPSLASNFMRKEKTQMTRKKVLIIALLIILLGGLQVYRWRGSNARAAGIGTASGMFALLSGVAVGLYGLALKDKR